ncbi:MAG: CBS domain-containing protein [Chloroflexota bacterium]
MHVILTHEQADFDAVASLLAAQLLDSEAFAVLPRKLNRNVRAYLTLYGEGLPLIEHRDLPRRKVTRLTLVDTQSLPSLRGLTATTQVHVIDHHPPDSKLSPEWTHAIGPVGATTTLLAEALQEAGIEPGLVAATLLLLGIYEDTGSLSYSGTSPRDVRASAWLLECGASLAVASDFLNHPLSPEQRWLYDQLLEAAETHRFHGLSVVIACAKAAGAVEEISTLAHKLRDLFDPAGLFVLVALDGNIQLVARSTTDSLNVAQLAQRFGGGGHDRAAAALIRGRTLDDVRQELLRLLPEFVRPDRTVGEIMSIRPQLLPADTSIAEAAERMQRFGYEGFPVVEGGKVAGLLTRRAVDRAMTHGMGGEPVSRVMDVGSVTVSPHDSVQHLQRVMIQHDWGQVPVAEPDTGEIIGIVTRTDLLKTLAVGAGAPASQNLSAQLEQALPPSRFALLRLIGRQAERNNVAAYVVGGFVRDLLLGTPSADFDLVVEGDAIGLARALADSCGGRVSSHHRFGTAKWRLDRRHPELVRALDLAQLDPEELPPSLDFVTARTEFYTHPTALPSVERGSIKLDLHRRDFTINTLALRLDGRYFGQLLDPWGGGRDLRQRLIRVLHSISFVDDPTRMLRAVRLEQRLGFRIEARTLELLHQALRLLARVSGERLRGELELIFLEDRRTRILERLQELGLLSSIHPALTWDEWLARAFREAAAFQPPADWRLSLALDLETALYALWLFRLPEAEARAATQRLHMPLAMSSVVLDANRLGRMFGQGPPDMHPSRLVQALEEKHESSVVAAWLAFFDKPEARAVLGMYLSSWRFVTPSTDGERLRQLRLPPGPVYREILWQLRAARLDGSVTSDEDEARLLERLLEEARQRG